MGRHRAAEPVTPGARPRKLLDELTSSLRTARLPTLTSMASFSVPLLLPATAQAVDSRSVTSAGVAEEHTPADLGETQGQSKVWCSGPLR
jgi:hypothetical protein